MRFLEFGIFRTGQGGGMELIVANPHHGVIPSRGHGISICMKFAYRYRCDDAGFLRFGNVGRAIPNHRVSASGGKQAELLEKELRFEPMFDAYLKAMKVMKEGGDRNSVRQTDLGGSSRSPRVRRARQLTNTDFRERNDAEVIDAESEEIPEERSNSKTNVKNMSLMKKRRYRDGVEVGVLNRISDKRGGIRYGVKKLAASTGVPIKSSVGYADKLRDSANGNLPQIDDSGKVINRKVESRKIDKQLKLEGAIRKELQVTEMQLRKQVHDRGRNTRNNVIDHGGLDMNVDPKRSMRNAERNNKYEIVTHELKCGSKGEKVNTKPSDEEGLASVKSSTLRDSYIEDEQHSFELHARATVLNIGHNREAVMDKNSNVGHRVSRNKESNVPREVLKNIVPYDGMDTERAAFRTFEVFTDVNNRPRVLRMELEEKIQKLAKWLNGTHINLPEWKFSKMLHSAKIKFTDHSILRIVQILGGLGNWRRALQVVQWLQSRERFESYKNRYIYTTVLSVLGKARRPMEALNLFHFMRQQLSSYPDMAAYHCIAVTLGQAGYLKELLDVIDCMRAGPEKKLKEILEKWDPCLDPDHVVYNAVLNACIRRKNWEGAFWVLQQLKQNEMQPSSTTYGLVMEVMLACGKYKLVHEFFKKVDKSSVPNTLTYRVLVNALWKEGKTEEAVLAVQDMERRGIVGSASLYYDLARCLCSAGRCQDALLQVDKICKVAKKPLVVTYTGLIKACLDSGSIQNGIYIYNHMKKFCSPNLVTCNMMLKAYVEHRMFSDAKDLFWKILEGGEVARTETDCEGELAPDSITFNTMLEVCVTEERWDEFECIYQRMLHHGYQFDLKRHLRLILEASKAGKGHLVETTYNQLVQSGRVPPPSIAKEMFCYKLQQEDCVGAIACIRGLAGDSPAFSTRAWLELFKNNSHRFRRETMVRLVNNLVAEGNQAYRPLESSCMEFIYSNMTTDSVISVTSSLR